MAKPAPVGAGLGVSLDMSLDEGQVDALRRAFKAADREAKKVLRRQLRSAGKIVRDEIRARTPIRQTKKRRPVGLLKRSTRIRLKNALNVEIYNNAKAVSAKFPGGYRYGKRVEFDYGGRYKYFYLGYDIARGRAVEEFDAVLVAAHKTFVKGG